MNLIEGKELMFRYKSDWVITDLNIKVKRGESVAIIGPNGSGKSTLLKLLSGILRPGRGEVLLGGKSLSRMSRKEISKNMALVSQEGFNQFPFVVKDVVLMGRAPYLRGFAFEGAKDHEIARWAMELTDIAPFSERMISEISGGERQRAYIARALAQDTSLLLLDEPTAHLDINHQIALAELLRDLNIKYKKTVISVTHDINLASYFYDRIILLSSGAIFRDGTPDDVITEEGISEVYRANVLVDINPVFKRPQITLLGGDFLRPRR